MLDLRAILLTTPVNVWFVERLRRAATSADCGPLRAAGASLFISRRASVF
jgi:hypothetical protein